MRRKKSLEPFALQFKLPKKERLEAPVLRAVMSLLKARGIFFLRLNSGALPDKTGRLVFFGFEGCPDILALPRFPPWRVWIETKSATGNLSMPQQIFKQIAESEGHGWMLARSAMEVEEWIRLRRVA